VNDCERSGWQSYPPSRKLQFLKLISDLPA